MNLKDKFTVASACVYKITNPDGTNISIHPGDILQIKLTDNRLFDGVVLSASVEAFNCLLINSNVIGRVCINWQLIDSIAVVGRDESIKGAWDISEPIKQERP